MRQIGKIKDESSARKLIAYLLTQEIKAVAEQGESGEWDVWIKGEDDVPRSKELFAEFDANPSDPKYSDAVEAANRLARQEVERHKKNRQNLILMRSNWSDGTSQKKPLVVTLMVITVAVFLLTRGWEYQGMLGGRGSAPEPTAVLKALLFVNPDEAQVVVAREMAAELATLDLDQFDDGGDIGPGEIDQLVAQKTTRLAREIADRIDIKLLNISRGEFWRLFTPMFIHFGIIHIVFNLLWLNALGGQFEARLGTFRFGLFVLLSAVVAQVAQQLIPVSFQGSSALTMAGGMSGVNFALGGFIWVKSRYEPQSGFYLSPIAMFTLILVLFVGIFDGGKSLSMANWAHGAGFGFGLLCGYLPFLSPRP